MFAFRRYRIIAFATPRMASRNPFCSQPKSFEKPMNTKRFHHVMRASWFISTVFRKNRRDKPLIKLYQYNQRKRDDFVECAFQNSAKIN